MVKLKGDKEVSIKMNEKFIARVDKIAAKVKVSRRQMLTNLVDAGVFALSTLEDVGIFRLSVLLRDIREKRAGKKLTTSTETVGGPIAIPIKLDEELLFQLDRLAEKAGLSRHHLMRNLLEIGTEQVEELTDMGITRMIVLIRDLPDSFKKFFEIGEKVMKAAGLS